jgi:hypothetical protein
MAGFLENTVNRLSSRLSALSRFNVRHEDLLLKNSQAIGFIESQLMARSTDQYGQNEMMRMSMAISDTTSQLRTKAVAFFQLDYAVKRERLRDVAANGEIEFVLETITDDVIVYDEENMFCFPTDLTGKMMYKGNSKEQRLKYQENVITKYNENFHKVYNSWGFQEGISAWQYVYQYLVEGHLAFEIIYDNPQKPREIIGYKELDPTSIAPQLSKDQNGKLFLQWTQYTPNSTNTRTLTDSQIIYLSYSNHFRTKRVSFVERLIRSFNLLRIIEQSKVIWHVMNAPIRLTTTVPVGSKSIQKAQEDVREFLNILKEDINFDNESGEIKVNGQPNILFYKNYVLPVNDRNEQVKIEPLQYPGPNLSGSELLNHFLKKLKMDSKIPYSRWEGQSGMGAFTLNAEGITREEIRYNKFVNRIRTTIQELITKPLWIQMELDLPEIKGDHKFRNAIGIQFNNDNLFEEMKERDVANKRLASFTAMKGVMNDDGTPYFSTEYLIRKELRLPDDEIEKNKNYKIQEAEAAEEAEAAAAAPAADAGAAAAPVADAGAAAAPAGGETPEGGGETIEGGETKGEGQL